jgi:molybdate transport system regulatory protein
MFEFKGILSLYAGESPLGGRDRIELLAKIGELGSIAAAARAVDMSYKGAWDAVDAMNNLAHEPLVLRAVGGRSGGGAQLTPRAWRLIEMFRAIEAEQQRLVNLLSSAEPATHDDIELVRRFMMRTSARNQLAGTVVMVESGAVNDVVELAIQGGQRIVATVTSDSTKSLGLVPGKQAFALIKASSVLIGLPGDALRLSARNQLAGTISKITHGAVNTEVGIQLPNGNVIVAIVTEASADELQLAEGLEVVAIIKASSIIVATVD